MLHTSFQGDKGVVSREEKNTDFYDIMAWRPYWLCDPNTMNKRLN